MLDRKIGSEELKMANNKMVQGIWNELINTLDTLTGSAMATWTEKKPSQTFCSIDLHGQQVDVFFCCDPTL